MKIQLELNLPGDGRRFLNFWDSSRGRDVVCRIAADGQLLLHEPYGDEMNEKPISLNDFITLIEKAAT